MRRFSAIVAVFSFAAAFIALQWMRSNYRMDWLEWSHGDHGLVLTSRPGVICVVMERNARVAEYVKSKGGGVRHALGAPVHPGDFGLQAMGPSLLNRLGWAWYWTHNGQKWQLELYVSYYSLFLVTLLPSITWICIRIRISQRARTRKQSGLCARCGYDLRASPERCPECGAMNTTTSLSSPLLVPRERAG
jgi:hypothetical protein